ncbi:NitT/TauT family transport system substrate-binding protein [Dysgonomonas sp. PH5-45]|uniref:ABC transporter substrate-binding protein n=1 Tax=unclassified Dysgonomonas TaxID=2630389 RepID=UPI002475C06B|nr:MULTISPECIES: MetQ/NlpA family ABC transporter substrate-binding protein [unclassified Dysgonomonas]MDH6354973.1 NitT/TauT family transport system substrate-binding protein [Dysgonomonas sp. PH5-45]MDH6387903.1 NitT/TauT family transport system substrate-binding protein [Dysgonomonas sp. PH5-37]
MKKTVYIFLVCTVALLLASCKNKTTSNQSTGSLPALTVGVMPSMDFLPLAVAQREGYFEEEGLDITIQNFYSANERDAAFQSGNVDGVVIDYTGAVLQKAGGIPLKLTSKCDAPFYIVASKNSGINDLAGLRGKQVAVSQNTVIDYCVDMALASAGMTAKDIHKVEINKIPIRFEMLMNGKIDATGLPNPFALMAQSEGAKVLVSNDSLRFAITGIMFKEEAINTKAESIKRMYAAYNKGVDYLKTHTVNDIADILEKDLRFKKEIIPSVKLPVYTKAEVPTDKDLQLVTDWLAARGLIDAGFDKASLVDGQFVK